MKKIFRFIMKIVFLIVLIAGCFAAINIYEGYNMYKKVTNKVSIEQKVNEIKNDKNYLKEDDIPKLFEDAIISVEDRRFYKHGAIDVISIGRALITDIKNKSLIEGGSTITQQLAKNMYLSREKKLSRKVAEVFIAFDLEKRYSKKEIIGLYINIIYFGEGNYGLNEASQGYFKKEPSKLSLYELTLLAGIPNAPSAYALNKNNELAWERQDLVIDAMSKNNLISNADIESIRKEQKIKQKSK
ncbi:MAG: biosynthetic peptidoglycan transglycosylase [Clostridia bacterium]